MSAQSILAFIILSILTGCGETVPTSTDSNISQAGFIVAGHMTDKRYSHYSILLQDGRVLIGGGAATGGSNAYAAFHSSAEIFDPETGSSRATHSMSTSRMNDKGTLLPDGRVVFASATQHTRSKTYPVEIFDPRTGEFTRFQFNPAFEKISESTLLSNGKILAFGRSGTIWTIDPETGEFEFKNRLAVPRGAYTATMLRDGRALITGGITDHAVRDSEIYDPSSNVITKIGSLTHERYGHKALPLADGTVLIAGGRIGDPASPTQVTAAERYDPTDRRFSRAGSPGNEQIRAAAVLNSGNVFFILRNGDAVLYDPENGTFHPTGHSIGPDYKLYSVTVLRDGRVLVIGGSRNGETLDQILAYRP